MRRPDQTLRRYFAGLLRGGESRSRVTRRAGRRATADRYAERLWTLGLTTAVARPSAWGKIDALTEATVWIQDLRAAERGYPGGRPHHLSTVRVLHGNTVVRTNLPSFFRTRDALAASRPAADGSVTLVLSGPSDDRAAPLPEWWRTALEDLGIDLAAVARQAPDRLLPFGSGIETCEIDPDILRSFKKSLRSAFDAVVESIEGNQFTLWLRPGGRTYPVAPGYRVPYTVGYCLPHRLRHYYLARTADPLDPRQLGETPGVGLEVLVEPHAGTVARTLSHVFTESRLSGFVAHHRACAERLAEVLPDNCAHVESIEKRIWNATEPHAFMMPLVNYGSEPHHTPRVVAHWYVPVSNLDPPTLYRLAALRQRANRAFFDTLYGLYCDAAARELTRWLLEPAAPPGSLNARLKSLSALYSVHVEIEAGVLDPAGGAEGIHAHFRTLDDHGFGDTAGLPWGQTLKVLWLKGMKALESVSIAWRPGGDALTARAKFDVLLRVYDNLRQEAQKRHDARYYLGVFRDMANAAGRIRQLIDEAGQHMGHRDNHAHLKAMDPLWYNDDYAVTCEYRGSRRQIDPDGPWFVPAHDCCFTKEAQGMEIGDCGSEGDECAAEHWRRLYYVFQGPADGVSPAGRGSPEQATGIPERSARGTPAAVRFTDFIERYGGRCGTNLWEWLKSSCAYGDDAPTVPAIVTILFMDEAEAVEMSARLVARFDRHERAGLRGLAPGWQKSLRGIADIARERSRTITLDVDDDCILRFLVRGRGIPRMVAAFRDKMASGVRAGTGMRQLADVLMAEDAAELTGFSMNGVRIDHDPGEPRELAVTWLPGGGEPADRPQPAAG